MTLDPVAAAARNAAIRTRAIQDAENFVRSHIWALEDAAINTLGDIYAGAFREMLVALTQTWLRYNTGDTWSASDVYFRERTEALLQQIVADVARLTDQVTATTFDAVLRGYSSGYYGRAWQLDMGLRGAGVANIPVLPAAAIRAAVLAPYQGSTFVDRFADARDEFVQQVRRSIVESQIKGEGIAQAQRRLAQALGVTGQEGFAARVETIARTEILRSSNLGALSIYEANSDVLEGWEWLATRDERTCPICGVLDGQVFKLGSPQSVPPTGSHPRCRCTPTPKLINSALEAKIVGPRQTYRDWAQERGVTIIQDGGVLRFSGKPAPKSSTPAAKAVRTPQPAGTPVSGALKVSRSKKLDPTREALTAIDQVHGDGPLPEIPVGTSTARSRLGAYWSSSTGEAKKITINVNGDHIRMTTAHEIGHFLDHHGIGAPGKWASERSDLLEVWRIAVKESQAYKTLLSVKPGPVTIVLEDGRQMSYYRDGKYLRYLQTTRELFARSYAQYVATRSGNAAMRAELDKLVRDQVDIPTQWGDDDFAPIAQAFDKLFAFLEWRK